MKSHKTRIRTIAAVTAAVSTLALGCVLGTGSASAGVENTPTPVLNSTGGGGHSTPSSDNKQVITPNKTQPPKPDTTQPATATQTPSDTGFYVSSSPRTGGQHVVTFNLDDGSSASYTRTVGNGQSIPRPTPDPVRAGWLFDGWFTGSVAYHFMDPVTTNLTLTAHWTRGTDKWDLSPNHGTTAGGTPVSLKPPTTQDLRFSQISGGMDSTLAIASDGNAYAWGSNGNSKLGNSRFSSAAKQSHNNWSAEPIKVDKPADVGAGFTFTQVSAGAAHSLALGSDGNIYAWGSNRSGLLGNSTLPVNIPGNGFYTAQPVRVDKPAGVDAGFRFTQISAGHYEYNDYSLALGSDGNAYAWGSNQYAQLGNPSIPSTSCSASAKCYSATPVKVINPDGTGPGFRYTQVSSGYRTSIALGNDGKAYAWGSNYDGLLGNTAAWNSPQQYRNGSIKPIPVDKPAGTTNDFAFVQAKTTENFSMALGSDGNAYAWGRDRFGKLGNYPNSSGRHLYPSPILVRKPSGTSSSFKYLQIDIHGYDSANNFYGFSTAIGSDGNAYAWGYNSDGQLGNSSAPRPGNTSSPSDDDWCSWAPLKVDSPSGVAAGIRFLSVTTLTRGALALASDGNVYGWGASYSGALGSGGRQDQYSPVKVKFPYDASISTVQFADRNSTTSPTKQTDGTWLVTPPWHRKGLVDLSIEWSQYGPQTTTHLAYTYDPRQYTVTFNAPEAGASTSQQVEEDELVTRPLADPARPGWVFDGWFRGDIAYDFSTPANADLTLTAHWSQVGEKWSINPDHGPEVGGNQVTLTPPTPSGVRLNQVSAGNVHSLAVGSDGNAYAWGSNSDGQLGDGSGHNQPTPVRVPKPTTAPGITYTQVSAGRTHSLALGSDGNIYAWGSNANGRLGDGSGRDQPKPVKVATPAGLTFRQISAGGDHSLALGSDHQMYAWGSNADGQLGTDTIPTSGVGNFSPIPVKVVQPRGSRGNTTYVQVSAGGAHSLSIDNDDAAYAWGSNQYGQLGTDSIPTGAGNHSTSPIKPATFRNNTNGFYACAQVSAGSNHSLAASYFTYNDRSSSGSASSADYIYTWGSNSNGQLSASSPSSTYGGTVPVGGINTKAIATTCAGSKTRSLSAGTNYSLCLASTWYSNDGYSGLAEASGSNTDGKLGIGTEIDSDEYRNVQSVVGPTYLINYVRVSAGGTQSLGIGKDGNTYAWGSNSMGQLGDKSGQKQLKPVSTRFPPRGIPTLVSFDGTPGTNLNQQADGSWQVTVPSHNAQTVNATIGWTLNDITQPEQTVPYTYVHIGILPAAGGSGILLIIMMGLFTMGGVLAVRRHRQEAATVGSGRIA